MSIAFMPRDTPGARSIQLPWLIPSYWSANYGCPRILSQQSQNMLSTCSQHIVIPLEKNRIYCWGICCQIWRCVLAILEVGKRTEIWRKMWKGTWDWQGDRETKPNSLEHLLAPAYTAAPNAGFLGLHFTSIVSAQSRLLPCTVQILMKDGEKVCLWVAEKLSYFRYSLIDVWCRHPEPENKGLCMSISWWIPETVRLPLKRMSWFSSCFCVAFSCM